MMGAGRMNWTPADAQENAPGGACLYSLRPPIFTVRSGHSGGLCDGLQEDAPVGTGAACFNTTPSNRRGVECLHDRREWVPVAMGRAGLLGHQLRNDLRAVFLREKLRATEPET